MKIIRNYPNFLLFAALIAILLVSLTLGRYPMSLAEIFQAVKASLTGAEITDRQDEILFLLRDIRLPRILAAILVGSALAISGSVYQAMFVNPLVSPGVLGVLAGASFGAALGIVVMRSWIATQTLAFVFACVAVGMAILLASLFSRSSMLVLILGGMVSSAFFTALSSIMKYLADPTSQLPELTYWLMGTFANANNSIIIKVGILMLAGIIFLSTKGKLMNVMSLGDEEAISLGIPVARRRLELIAVSTFVSASTVAIAGTIQWVGLVIPHIMRFFVGPDNRRLLPATAIAGGAFMLFIDSIVRSALPAEVPIGIVTAIVLLPLFIVSLYRHKGVWK